MEKKVKALRNSDIGIGAKFGRLLKTLRIGVSNAGCSKSEMVAQPGLEYESLSLLKRQLANTGTRAQHNETFLALGADEASHVLANWQRSKQRVNKRQQPHQQ